MSEAPAPVRTTPRTTPADATLDQADYRLSEAETAYYRGTGSNGKRDLARHLRRLVATTTRVAIPVAALVVQLALLVAVVVYVDQRWAHIVLPLSAILSVVAVLAVVNAKAHPVYRLAWTIPILTLPVFGALLYFLLGRHRAKRRHGRERGEATAHMEGAMGLHPEAGNVSTGSARARLAVDYIASSTPFEAFGGTATTYFPLGELAFESILADLEKAERYIFLEFYIVAEGELLARLMEVLIRKARQGVSVRFLYDGMGVAFRLPPGFRKEVARHGIDARPVNPFGLGLTLRYNNRDHRKIVVVDGRVAYTGGVNVADEYVNITDPLGHWKDTAVRLEGPGAWGLAVIFMASWEQWARDRLDAGELLPATLAPLDEPGIVIPFDDVPDDTIDSGRDLLLSLIYRCHTSLDLTTPYLIPDDDLLGALVGAARSGVRVRLLCPSRNDSGIAQMMARAHYEQLIDGGVEVYEYPPGFVHAKQFLADDRCAVIGTINLDYRSLYLNQEDAVWMWRTSCLPAMKADLDQAFASSRRISLDEASASTWLVRLARTVARVFAPLF